MKPDWFATNARALLEQRRKGSMPAGAVNVNLDISDQDIGYAGHVITVRKSDPLERLDWRMLANLTVWIWADDSQPIERLVALTKDIVKVNPLGLYVRFVDTKGIVHDVDCGSGTHRPGLPEHGVAPEHNFIFCPMNLAGSRIGRELCRALVPVQKETAAWN